MALSGPEVSVERPREFLCRNPTLCADASCCAKPPLPWPVFWNQDFSGGSLARSLGNKDLEVKSLFFFHLGTFRRRLGLRDGPFAFSRRWTPISSFRPDQKVKLDKTDATRGGLSLAL